MAAIPIRAPATQRLRLGEKPPAFLVGTAAVGTPKNQVPTPRYLRLHFWASWCCALVLVAGLTYALLPRIAEQLANLIPATWVKSASMLAQSRLDHSGFTPTHISAERIATLEGRFAALAAPSSGAPPYRLLFRNGGRNGALTYSLPDGTIVVTDELLNALPDDTEVLALLCHELGHLRYHHILRASIENHALVLVLGTVFDLQDRVISQLAQGFLDATTSAEAGVEADRFARAMLEENGIPSNRLLSALTHLCTTVDDRPLAQSPTHTPGNEQLQTRLLALELASR